MVVPVTAPYAAAMAANQPSPEFLTRQEAADLLRVTVQTIDDYAKAGMLTKLRARNPKGAPMRRTLFRTEEVRGLVERADGGEVK